MNADMMLLKILLAIAIIALVLVTWWLARLPGYPHSGDLLIVVKRKHTSLHWPDGGFMRESNEYIAWSNRRSCHVKFLHGDRIPIGTQIYWRHDGEPQGEYQLVTEVETQTP